MKLRWCNPTGLAAVCLLGLVACDAPNKPASPRETTARSVRTARAEIRPFERALVAVGSLAAREEAVVAAQVAGQIEQCRVDLGDQVTNRQVLVLIDTAAYDARLRQSEANRERAQAAAASAKRDLQRIRELQRDKIASASDLDRAVAAADQTEAEVKAAEAAVVVANLDLERSRVKAPFAGAVAARLASVGDYVAVGAPIVRLVQTDPLRLRLDVPERDSPLVRTGQTVRVMAESGANASTGQLARLAPAIRPLDRMLVVEADVPNKGGLRAGLFARAQIVINPSEPALSVPAAALVTFAGLEKVVALENGKAVEKTVATGRREGNWVEILSGLTQGEAVVLEPAGIRTGQPLTPDAKAR